MKTELLSGNIKILMIVKCSSFKKVGVQGEKIEFEVGRSQTLLRIHKIICTSYISCF